MHSLLSDCDFLQRQSGEGIFCCRQCSENQSQSANSAKEHQHYQNQPGNCSQAGRDAKGQAHRSNGGSTFKQTGHQGKVFCPADDHAACQEQGYVQKKYRHGIFHGIVGNPAAKELSVFPFPEDRHRAGCQHGKGGCFHTAGCGAGTAADEHQQAGYHLTGFAEKRQIQCVESSSSWGHSLKQGTPEPL